MATGGTYSHQVALKRRAATALLAVFLIHSVNAQQATLRFKRMSIREGLSQSTVYAIAQDSIGFVWLGTQSGLNRYDGYTFKVYAHDGDEPHSLSDDYIQCLLVTQSGDLWIGTARGGLNRYDQSNDQFDSYRSDPKDPHSLSSNNVRALCEDGDGLIWIATPAGLNCLDPVHKSIRHFACDPRIPSSLSSNDVKTVFCDSRGDLWIGTGNKVDKLEAHSDKFVHVQLKQTGWQGGNGIPISNIYEDRRGIMWFSSIVGGLSNYDRTRDKFNHYRHDEKDRHSIGSDHVGVVYEDSRGNFWVATYGGGLNRFDRTLNLFFRYRHDPFDQESLADDFVGKIMEDGSGLLWVGTGVGGVCVLDWRKQSFVVHRTDPSDKSNLSHNNVRGVIEDRDGGLWVATMGGGLNYRKPGSNRFSQYRNNPRDPRSISSDFITCVLQRRNGELWIGTKEDGLCRYDRNSVMFIRITRDPRKAGSLGSNAIETMYEDRSGVLWVGTFRGAGLHRYDDRSGRFVRYDPNPHDTTSICGSYITCIHEDRKGNLWVGTLSEGLNRFDRRRNCFVHYRHLPLDRRSLSNDGIECIREDANGNLWIGTSGGGLDLYNCESETFVRFSDRDGLPNNVIYGILDDSHGNLWLSTNRGLSRFDPRNRLARNFEVDDGLQGNEFNGGAFFRANDGRFYFGGIDGFVAFYPDEIQDNLHVPPVALTNFRVFDEPVRVPSGGRIALRYDQNFFSFEFAALDFAAPQKNKYAFKLEGVDRDWVAAGGRRYASYTNLDPGEYRFRAKGSNRDGIWNEEGASVRVTILPPFWSTSWFRILATTAVIGALGGAYSFRVRRLHRARETQELFSRRLIETQETERRRIAGELHDGIGQDLLIIHNELQQKMHPRGISPKVLQELSKSIIECINDVRQIASNLHPHQLERLGLDKAIESDVGKLTHSSGVNISVKVEPIDTLLAADTKINIYRIVQEALSNVVKHSRASVASVEISKRKRSIHVLIKDNGDGFDVKRRLSSGVVEESFGLISMAERVKLIGGELEITSAPMKGTSINLRVPLSSTTDTRITDK